MKGHAFLVQVAAVLLTAFGLWVLVQGEIKNPITETLYVIYGWLRLYGVFPVILGMALIWATNPANKKRRAD